MTRAVETFLARRGHHIMEIQSVLLFSNPGTHVDVIRPAIRVVLMDGLDRFISGLTQTRTFLTSEDIQQIVDALVQHGSAPVPSEAGASQPPAGGGQAPALRPGSALAGNVTRNYVTLSNRINLTRGQWIFLGSFAFIQVIIIVAFIIYVLLTN
jgi:hypothetical protein